MYIFSQRNEFKLMFAYLFVTFSFNRKIPVFIIHYLCCTGRLKRYWWIFIYHFTASLFCNRKCKWSGLFINATLSVLCLGLLGLLFLTQTPHVLYRNTIKQTIFGAGSPISGCVPAQLIHSTSIYRHHPGLLPCRVRPMLHLRLQGPNSVRLWSYVLCWKARSKSVSRETPMGVILLAGACPVSGCSSLRHMPQENLEVFSKQTSFPIKHHSFIRKSDQV